MRHRLLAATALALAGALPASAQASELFDGLELKQPECVHYDAEADRFLIANINGKPAEADGNGFIGMVPAQGEAVARWIEGGRDGVELDAPKGMAMHGHRLYVADITNLRVFDGTTGEPLESIAIEGAAFLNDVAVGRDGTVYVTDTGANAIYAVAADGTVRTLVSGDALPGVNGIDIDAQGRLVVVTFGSNKLITLSPEGTIETTRELEAGKLDGLVVLEDGTAYVSSWETNGILEVAPDGTGTVAASDMPSPAAFDIDRKRRMLVVPLLLEDRIATAPLRQ
jgi:hypothetical protein